jgi:hypothetical protein
MDMLFIGLAVGLWGVMVLVVWGLQKLERRQGGRS